MWYTLPYANTFICTPPHGGRAGNIGDQSPVSVRLYSTPVPDPSRQCRGPADDRDCWQPPLHRSDRTQCHSCLPSSRSRLCSSPSRRARTPRRPSSMLGPARPCGRCCIRVHGHLASLPAGGRSRSPPRSVSPKASRRGWSATKLFDWPCAGCGCPGSEPSIGLPVPIRPISEKKTARPPDPAGDDPSHVGPGL